MGVSRAGSAFDEWHVPDWDYVSEQAVMIEYVEMAAQDLFVGRSGGDGVVK